MSRFEFEQLVAVVQRERLEPARRNDPGEPLPLVQRFTELGAMRLEPTERSGWALVQWLRALVAPWLKAMAKPVLRWVGLYHPIRDWVRERRLRERPE